MKVLGLFDPDVIWTLIPLCGWLWSLGGSGYKPFRRFGVPAAIALYTYGFGCSFILLSIQIFSSLAVIGFGPGYGDDFEEKLRFFYWPYLFILGATYGLCNFALAIHFVDWGSLWIGAGTTCLIFVGTMRKKWMPWKFAEILTGMSVGMTGAIIIN